MKRVDDFEEFSASCANRRCLRNTIFNAKTCARDSKRKACHIKYLNKLDKEAEKRKQNKGRPGNPDPEYDKLVHDCWVRDAGFEPETKHLPKSWKNYCCIWKCLSIEEREEAQQQVGFYLNAHVDVSHIKGKGGRADLKYLLTNVLISGRFFSNRLDKYLDPVSGEPITAQERDEWFERAKQFSGQGKLNEKFQEEE